MVDIHSHILWGLDDGARSFEQSIAMVRMAAAHGTSDIVATPHANLEYKFQPELNREKIAQLARAAGALPRIHYGCDFHFYPAHVDLAVLHPERFTIDGKRYLLIEFSDLLIFKETAALLTRLRSAGITPILTHPERNYLLHARIEELSQWVGSGLLTQVTAQSLLGRFGPVIRKFSEELLRRGMVHFVSSDAHDCDDRPPRLDLAHQAVLKNFGAPLAEALFEINPGAVLAGVPLPPLPTPAPTRKWYHFGVR